MNNGIAQYFKLPENVLKIHTEPAAKDPTGFFQFQGITCFGSIHGIDPAADPGEAYEVSEASSIINGLVSLPFDPQEVINNLRYERYIANDISQERDSLTRNVYYLVRRVLPIIVRKHFQRYRLRDWRDISHPRWPIDTSVDDLNAAVLKKVLKIDGSGRLPFIWFWPEGHRGCIMITHDVETPIGRDFCEELIKIDGSYGFRAAFELVPEKRYKITANFLDSIRAAGCEVCLHGLYHDGHLFREKEEFLRRARLINEYLRAWEAVGFRSPVMYRNPEWISALEIDYDMSWPTVGHLDPQRGGCCTVMPYFIGNMVELPLTLTQDYSLFHILRQHDIELWKRQIADIRAHDGLLSCIVHPDYVTDSKEQRVYTDLLAFLRQLRDEARMWAALPREIAQWWRERESMRLVKGVDGWHIEGKGSDRARIAWVMLEKDELKYSF